MSVEQIRRDLAQLAKDLAKVRAEMAKEDAKAGAARRSSSQKRQSALRSRSASSRDSNSRQAGVDEKKAEAAERRSAQLQDKVAALLRRQQTKSESLRTAERAAAAAAARQAEAAKRKARADQATEDRLQSRRRRQELDHARDVARIARTSARPILIKEPEPERLRVLYLTASPATENVPRLRVDAEVNNVLKALRGAKHRDLVELSHRPAATIEDLVDGLNDLRPHVVHFSGHARRGLLLDTADPATPGDRLIDYSTLAKVLAATDDPPVLVVLNACETDEAIRLVLQTAAMVITTQAAVEDASAAIFATQFYGAIASAQSVGAAFEQSRAMVALALPGEDDVLTLTAADTVDPHKTRLVRPLP